MSRKMARRRRHDRLKRVRIERREDRLFFGRGTFPASARRITVCSCGARAFSRSAAIDDFDDFDAVHAYCDGTGFDA